MLPKAHRLHLSADIRQVLRRGRRFVLPEAVISVVLRTGEPSRFAVITPKTVGNAVARHAVARRVRAGWEPVLAEHETGVELVVRCLTPAALSQTVSQWTENCSKAIDKAAEKVER